MKEDWIKDLKVGDEVIIVSGGWNNTEHVERVEKVNKTTVRVCGTLFSIIDGFERRSGWHHSRIIQCTEEEKERIKIDAEKRKLCVELSKIKWETIPIDRLRKIYSIFKDSSHE